MTSLVRRWELELSRRFRLLRGKSEAAWPPVPPGVFLSPSDADISAYDQAPLALTFSRTAQGDLTGWQQRVREKLRDLMGIASAAPQIEATPTVGAASTTPRGIRRQTYYLRTAPQRHVPMTVVWNTEQADRSLPVMLCLQGHTSGVQISWGEVRLPVDAHRIENGGDFALQAIRNGHVAVCIEQIGFGERREQALAHRWDHTCVDACNRALLLGRTVLGDRVADVSAVIDCLQTHPSGLPAMNTNRIHAMGNSAGGETALFATALDPRIEAVIASGCVGAWRKTSGVRRTCPDTVVPGILAWLEYSDILALCAPRPYS